MSEAILYSVQDGVARLAVAHPPSNVLTRPVRAGLMAGIARAEADPAVQEIMLIGGGRSFPTGDDVTDAGRAPETPTLAELCDRVERCGKPVVAAVHGTALGGGLALALSAHYRVAHRGASVAVPEILLGLMPAAGTTQRLPRLIGAGPTLDILLSGRGFDVTNAPAEGLFDSVTDGDLAEVTQRFCLSLRSGGHGPRPTRDIRAGFGDPAAYQAQLAEARGAAPARPEASRDAVIAAVEAAMLLPFEAGLALDAESAADLAASDQSAALRHGYLAERAAGRFDLPEDVMLPPIRTICVLGGGPLAMQIAASALQAQLQVRWGTRDPEPLAQGVAQVRALFAKSVARGAVSQARADALLANLTHGDSAAMTPGSDIILHAARGQGNVPAPQGAIRAVAMSERVDELGVRFSVPVFASRLVEVIEGPGAVPAQLAAGLALARAMKKVPVRVASMGDSVAGRMMAALQRAADALVDAGQSPYAIDAALRGWGWSRPPFETRDLLGLAELAGQPRADGARNWSALLAAQGRTGRAGGQGFYTYPAGGGAPEADPAVARILDGARPIGAPMKASHIVTLIIGALANEGARLLEERWVSRASDIDVVMLLAHDFPRRRGGPMKAADLLGLFAVSQAMRRFDHVDKAFWQPRPLWPELIKNGNRFCG
ncbi:enoyl-CoA hydratase-related protein [Thalassococcus sp. BH17M4-6]|uniref:enoyl-CoA hydratase-related protein n=1 Tax=Thalassococcus sp. BH17M4-6 TaxID=3413148 RepID=UPI003BDBA956